MSSLQFNEKEDLKEEPDAKEASEANFFDGPKSQEGFMGFIQSVKAYVKKHKRNPVFISVLSVICLVLLILLLLVCRYIFN